MEGRAVPETAAITSYTVGTSYSSTGPHPQHPRVSVFCQNQGRIHRRLLACPVASLLQTEREAILVNAVLLLNSSEQNGLASFS